MSNSIRLNPALDEIALIRGFRIICLSFRLSLAIIIITPITCCYHQPRHLNQAVGRSAENTIRNNPQA